MVREVSRRLLGVVTLMWVTAGSLVFTGEPAGAAPKTPRPTSVTITGEGIKDPLTVRADAQPEVFAAVLDQVSWLTGPGQATGPKATELGPKYTVVVFVGTNAKQTYDLYPEAEGGPRAYRPAKQPDRRRTTAAWFFGRLNMAEVLAAAGAPVGDPAVTQGGLGAGERVIPDEAIGSGEDLSRLLGELRRLVLLNGAVLVSITLGLAGIALLVRRRTR